MKKLINHKGFAVLFLILSFALSSAIVSLTAQAAVKSNAAVNDDPGIGRLSGDNIPNDFYGTAKTNNSFAATPFSRYGSTITANAYTGKTYTHRDQFDGFAIINGIDVSYYQKTIDWASVKAAGIDFAFIRAGYRGYGAGALFSDTLFDSNMDGAAAAGVATGIYIFSQATTEAEAEEEAQFILDRIGSHAVNMPIVLDFEFASDSKGETGRLKTANLTKDAATNVCLAFCNKIYAAGYTPMVYANVNMLTNHLNADVISASYPIWLANYTTSTAYAGTFSYWQYASNGAVNGIEGNVDMNYFYGAPAGNIAPAIVTPISDQKYTGAAITPDFTVTMNGVTLTKDIDYITSYINNIDVGTATITITGINQYNGTRNITFNIIDDVVLPEISGLSAKTKTKNYITLQWDTVADITGYELYRASSPNGEYALIKTITKASTGTFKNTKLNEGQCYFYRIRAYKDNNGVISYGNLSGTASIYTKTSYTRLALPKSDMDIYSDIDVHSEVVTGVEKNDFLKVTFLTYDDAGNRWYRVSYDGVSGYIPVYRVTTAKQGKIKTSKVNVRKKAKVSSKKVTTLKKNKKVAVIKTKKTKTGTWYYVLFVKGDKTYKAWIYSIYVKI